MVVVCRGSAARPSWPADSDHCLDLRKHDLVYPVGIFWRPSLAALSGVQVKVAGLSCSIQTDLRLRFESSFLSRYCTVFIYTGRRIGLLAKKELLKVPVLGVEWVLSI